MCIHMCICVYIYIYIYTYVFSRKTAMCLLLFLKRLNTKENMHDYGKGGAYFYLVVVVVLQKSGKRPHSTSMGG